MQSSDGSSIKRSRQTSFSNINEDIINLENQEYRDDDNDVSSPSADSAFIHTGYHPVSVTIPTKECRSLSLNVNKDDSSTEKLVSQSYSSVKHQNDLTTKPLVSKSIFKVSVIMGMWILTSFTSIVLNKYILTGLDVDPGVLGDEASRLFFMLKKRYLKKRNLVKKSNYMQSKSRILDKAKRDLEQYSFMNWLDQYLRVRRCKSEIRGGYFYESHVKRENHTKREDGSSSSQGNWERTSSMHADWGGSQANREWNGEDVPIVTCLPNDSIDEMELYEDDDDDDIDTIGDHDKMERIKCSPLVQVYKDSRRPPSVVSSDEIINVKSTTSMTKMNNDPLIVVDPTPSMHKHYLDRFHSSEQSKLSPTFEPSPSSSRVHVQHAFDKQPIDVLQGLFAKSLAAELTNLPEYERCLAQHEINQVLFKYKMIVLQKSKQTNEK